MTLFLALLAGLATLTLVVALASARQQDRLVRDRLSHFAERVVTLEQWEMRQPMMERLIKPIMRSWAATLYKLTPQSQIATLRRNLMLAGYPGGMQVQEFLVMRGSVAVIALCLVVMVGQLARLPLMGTVGVAIPVGGLGYILPSFWLGGRVRARQAAIERALPEAIDLLTVCVEAGSGLDASIAKVTARWKGPLSEELERVLVELRMGKPRREALRGLAERTGVLDVQTFTSAIIQADQLGIGLVKVLRIQAEQMRQRRRLRAEEAAQKAPVKMLFPLVFLIFPALYIVILGPAFINLVAMFTSSGGRP